jgi:hypothetical protein
MRRLTPFAGRFDMSSVPPGTTDVDDKYSRQAQVDDFGSAFPRPHRAMLAEESSDLSLDGLHFAIGD